MKKTYIILDKVQHNINGNKYDLYNKHQYSTEIILESVQYLYKFNI